MKTIAVDFDGVIHKYSEGWKDGTIYDDPIPGAFEAIKSFMESGYAVFIHSTRNEFQIAEWMNQQTDKFQTFPLDEGMLNNGKFFNNTNFVGVTNKKLPAQYYIDDRAIRFPGSWSYFEITATQQLIETETLKHKTVYDLLAEGLGMVETGKNVWEKEGDPHKYTLTKFGFMKKDHIEVPIKKARNF